MHIIHEEQMLDKLDAIISILKKYEAISEENVQILKANQKSLKTIIEELHKIRVNTSYGRFEVPISIWYVACGVSLYRNGSMAVVM